MLDFFYRYINPVRLNLFADSVKASLGVILSLCLTLWLSDNPAHYKFAFIFSLQLAYAKNGIGLKKRFPFTIFWSVCLGLALSIVPLLSGLLLLKSAIIVGTIFATYNLKDRLLIFNNNLADQFVLDFCVFLFLLPAGKFDPYFLLISVICGGISCITEQLILNKKSLRVVKFYLLRTFLKIPPTLHKLSKKAKNLQHLKRKENYFFYLEAIGEIQDLESVLIPEEKQKIFYTKLIFFTATAFRALKIIEHNLSFCSYDFRKDLSYILKHYSIAYRKIAAYVFHKEIDIGRRNLNKMCQNFKKKYSQSPNQAQAKILVSLERLAKLPIEISECLQDENK